MISKTNTHKIYLLYILSKSNKHNKNENWTKDKSKQVMIIFFLIFVSLSSFKTMGRFTLLNC